MDNALENNNLEEGQVNDNVGQDEATQQQEDLTIGNHRLSIFNQKKINCMLKTKS